MNNAKIKEDEKDILSSFTVSQNESNKDLTGDSKERNLFNVLNKQKKIMASEKVDDSNSEHRINRPEYTKDEGDDSRQMVRKEKICDTESENENSGNEIEDDWWVIPPDNLWKKIWDLVIAVIILYSSFMIPFEIAFIEKMRDSAVDHIITVFLTSDMILSFISAYINNKENLIKNRKKIALKYLKTWFFIDLISVIPFSEFASRLLTFNKITCISRLTKLYRMLNLTKLLRISKLFGKGNANKTAKYFLEKLKISLDIERTLFFIMTFLVLNNLCACLWYFIARLEEFCVDSWVVRLGYVDNSNFELYIISLYRTLTIVTTVGYGGIKAGTTIERVYNLFIMSFGVILYSYGIFSLSSVVGRLNQKTVEKNRKLGILCSIKKKFNLNQGIYDKARKFIKFHLSQNQIDQKTLLGELPYKLKIELSQIMQDKAIKNLHFFRDQPINLYAHVAPLLKLVSFSENDYLYKAEDIMNEMYFVAKGTVIFCLDKDHGEREFKEIKKSKSFITNNHLDDNFGETEMCLNEKLSYNIKIKSKNCQLYVLKKKDFLILSVNFKGIIEIFLQQSLIKYLRLNDVRTKLTREFDILMNKCEDSNNSRSNSSNGDLQNIEEERNDAHAEVPIELNGQEHNDENSSSDSNKDKDEDMVNNLNKKQMQNQLMFTNLIKAKNVEGNQMNLINYGNSDKLNIQFNIKFLNKIDKIIEHLERRNYQFKTTDKNPKDILHQLKNEEDLVKKNELINEIEIILKEFYESIKKNDRLNN